MKSAFFIMQLYQKGNIGSHEIKKQKDNPTGGYGSYKKAKAGMLDLWAKDNWELNADLYYFAIMELFW